MSLFAGFAGGEAAPDLTADTGAPAGSRVVLRCVVGSTSHGTNVAAQDDRDEMAIAVEPESHVLGLSQWETSVRRTQPEGVRSGPGDLDLVTHSLRKFARLASKGNPTILIPLFVTGGWVLYRDEIGEELVAKRHLFLSRLAGGAFLGYMDAQLARLRNESGGRHGKMRPELVERYGFDTKYAGHVVRLGMQGLELMNSGAMTMPMPEAQRDAVVAIRTGKWTYDQVLQYAADLRRELKDAIAASPLPEEPDRAGIDALLVKSYYHAWAW